jgi:hypothetical protein
VVAVEDMPLGRRVDQQQMDNPVRVEVLAVANRAVVVQMEMAAVVVCITARMEEEEAASIQADQMGRIVETRMDGVLPMKTR